MDWLTVANDAVSGKIHDDVGKAQMFLRRVVGGAAHDGTDTRYQLGWAERLRHVIVGAAVEATNSVALLAARGQHDDRQAAQLGRPANLAADLDPRDQRQHPVE